MTATDYAPILAAATDAARAAGDILRAEFLRPGGPRGSAGTCPADADAERAIRAKLSAAFPTFGWLAEETGGATAGTDPAGHAWVVDPNDGTDPFLSGMRGSSVSIGLLRAGVPVLGVVYAYAAAGFPDGDLIAWAEGCGPITRNGKTVDRPPLADRLTAAHTVLLSQNADHASAANARLSAPARFRAVPGIAYRLALAAAGDGEAAHSLSGPRAWDVAAGHALLRGVGGDLVDERGALIKYPADGRSVAGRCFGGSATVARELAGRPWDAVFARETVTERFGLTRPRRDAVCPDARLLDRAIGCLVGQIAGDSLGGLVEFQSAGAIARKHPAGVRELADGGHWDILAGQPTDDSEMALMLARSIVAAGTYDPAAALAAYAHWYESPPFDIGGTTSQALSAAASAIAAGRDPLAAVAAAASQGSQANGALMRVSPLAVLAHAAPVPQAVAWARADAALTHPHEVCRDANALFVATVAYAIRTGAAPADVYAFARRTADEQKLHADVRSWLADAEAGPPGDFQHQMGWVRIAMQNAFHQLLTAKTPQDAMADTVGRGGDTDTNAAIAGALLGAAHGVSAMPPSYVDRVLTCRPIAKVAAGRHPRPRDFWPVDVMYLAERLVVLGRVGSAHRS